MDLSEYTFYDNRLAVSPWEVMALYRFVWWGKSRTDEGIARMLQESSMCFSVRYKSELVGFCRLLTDFVYRASLWDIIIHPDHQGQGLGTALMNYVLEHPAVKDIPLIITYVSDLYPFLEKWGFKQLPGAVLLLRSPIEYS
jgi:ribosomal protein S18 acetylase RimI-like enzyme